MIKLEKKVALVTGGSRGIGAATAMMLAQAGAAIALTYARESKKAHEVAEKIASYRKDCLALKVDGSVARQVKLAVKKVIKHFGRIDILVNNAGVWKHGEIGKMTERQWDETIDINLKGAFLFCNEVVPIMKKQHDGKIINIASTAGQRGEAFHSHYAASKGGIIAFTKSLGAELAPHNIIVNCVSPGWVETDMAARALNNPKERREIERSIPRGRVASPEEIAGSVLFLASDLSNHLVGAVVSVNGGSVMVG